MGKVHKETAVFKNYNISNDKNNIKIYLSAFEIFKNDNYISMNDLDNFKQDQLKMRGLAITKENYEIKKNKGARIEFYIKQYDYDYKNIKVLMESEKCTYILVDPKVSFSKIIEPFIKRSTIWMLTYLNCKSNNSPKKFIDEVKN